jgi:hypothetical protein
MESEKQYPSDANSLFRQVVESAWMRLNKRQKLRYDKQKQPEQQLVDLV